MKSWVVYNDRHMWQVFASEKEARAYAAANRNTIVRGFAYGKGDKVKSILGETLTIERPACSVTDALGYKVSGGKWEFYAEDDIVGVA